MLTRRLLLALPAALAAGCATDIRPDDRGTARLLVQNPGLNPRNGGFRVEPQALQAGDIILSSANGISSIGIRLLTLSPVSHAALYTGDGAVAEAVGHGIQRRGLPQLLQEESTVVAFRHPSIGPEHMARMRSFAEGLVGQRYNFVGVMLQAPFSVERRVCELPLLPEVLRDVCIQGVGAVQLGLGSNRQFFCSQFVLEAYRSAGLPLTDADPRFMSPADLLHMREDDVPSVRIHQPLQYLGHLKYELA